MTDPASPAHRSRQRPLRRVHSTSLARFRREAWWQVTFPVVAAAVLALAAVVLVLALGGGQAASVIADYSLILLILANAVLGLILLAMLGGLIYLITALLRATPPYTNAAQQFAERIYHWVDKQSDRIAHVVIVVRSTAVGISTYLRRQGIIPDSDKAGDSSKGP